VPFGRLGVFFRASLQGTLVRKRERVA
jgi:hypothetical protein